MLRAAVWTGGLFAAGSGICQLFHQAWVEPVVLLALGTTLLFVSSRRGGASGERNENEPA